MKEVRQETTQVIPPIWCGSICRNSMSEKCVEHCAIKRDCSYFESRRNIKLINLPPFPKTTEMTRAEKFTLVTLYLEKIVDHLQGVNDEYITVRRPDTYSSPSSQLSPIVEVKDILPDLTQAISTSEAGQECESKGIRPEELAQPTD
jgi:hypothetical protein